MFSNVINKMPQKVNFHHKRGKRNWRKIILKPQHCAIEGPFNIKVKPLKSCNKHNSSPKCINNSTKTKKDLQFLLQANPDPEAISHTILLNCVNVLKRFSKPSPIKPVLRSTTSTISSMIQQFVQTSEDGSFEYLAGEVCVESFPAMARRLVDAGHRNREQEDDIIRVQEEEVHARKKLTGGSELVNCQAEKNNEGEAIVGGGGGGPGHGGKRSNCGRKVDSKKIDWKVYKPPSKKEINQIKKKTRSITDFYKKASTEADLKKVESKGDDLEIKQKSDLDESVESVKVGESKVELNPQPVPLEDSVHVEEKETVEQGDVIDEPVMI